MTLVSYSPFREFENLFNRNRAFPLRRVQNRVASHEGEPATWRPLANISETEKEYLIKAELPEVARKDVELSVNDGVITIKGERRLAADEESETQHRTESLYGNFARSFTLPDDVDETAIHARSKDGVLKIYLPKAEVKQPKSIDIKIA